jgi:drug/metabolite transporter (DMT)-like permease
MFAFIKMRGSEKKVMFLSLRFQIGSGIRMKTESNHQAGIQRTRKRTWMGIGLLNLSALGYAVAMLSANMAVKNGIDIHTTNAMRYTVALVFLFLFQRIRRHNAKLPPRERVISLSLGFTVFIMAAGYLGATQYIPISLAVLIFYTFPLFVVVISRFTENEPMTQMRLIAIIIAFVGLGFALEIGSIARLNWQGVAYGFFCIPAMKKNRRQHLAS